MLRRALPLLLLAGCSGGGSEGADVGPDAVTCASTSVEQLAYSTDGRRLAAARSDGVVAVFETAGSASWRLRVARTPSARIALTEDGALLAVAAEGTVKLWSVASGTVSRTLATGTGAAVSLKLSDSPTPNLLVTFAGATDNVKVWRLSDGILVGLASGAPAATFTHADEAILLLDEAHGSFQVVSFGARVLRQVSLPLPLGQTAFAADGAYLGGVVTGPGSMEQHLAIISVGDDAFTWQSAESTRGTRQLVFLENPSRIAQLSDRSLLYDHGDGRVLMPLPALDRARSAVAAPDGSALAAVSGEQIIFISTADGSVRPGPTPCP